MRRFEFTEGASSKFWRIALSGSSFTVRWGRIGTTGQEQTKSFSSAAKAQAEHDRLIGEKLGKGYQDVVSPSTDGDRSSDVRGPLIEQLCEPAPAVYEPAVEELSRIAQVSAGGVLSLRDLLLDKRAKVRGVARQALAKVGGTAIAQEIAALLAEGTKEVHRKAALALISMGAEALPYVPQLLRDQDPDVRWQATEIVRLYGGGIPNPRAMVSDKYWHVRESASGALIKVLVEGALPWLEKLARDRDSMVASAAVYNLSQLGSPAAKRAIQGIKTTNPMVRASIDRALGTDSGAFEAAQEAGRRILEAETRRGRAPKPNAPPKRKAETRTEPAPSATNKGADGRRRFEMEKGGVRKFCEIELRGNVLRWHYGDVGGVSESRQTHWAPALLTEEHDKLIRKALRAGYREVLVAPLPKKSRPPSVKRIREIFAPWREKHVRPAWKPVTRKGDNRQLSRFGGSPMLAAGEKWPHCQECGAHMQFFLQIELARCPRPIASRGSGLLQLFYCSHGDEYPSICDTASAFSGANLVRLLDAPAAVATEPKGLKPFPVRAIGGWREFADYPGSAEHEQLGLVYEHDLKAEHASARCKALGIELLQVDLEVEIAEAIADAGKGDKLGGWPGWVQRVEYPKCRRCRRKMEHLMQVDSEDNLPYLFGDAGTAHITQCPTHRDVLAFGWQCS